MQRASSKRRSGARARSARAGAREPWRPRAILVVDVGGTHVKCLASGCPAARQVASGPSLSAAQMVRAVQRLTPDWSYDAVSIGYPGVVRGDRPTEEPVNLGVGWVGFDFEGAFGCRVKMINDGAMQALGSYEGGRMLFIGLGTGMGSALIADGVLVPLELAHLPYRKGRSYEDYLGIRGLERLGKARWRAHVAHVLELLHRAFVVDDIVVGGGHARHLRSLPAGVRLGDNALAFSGGFRLWER